MINYLKETNYFDNLQPADKHSHITIFSNITDYMYINSYITQNLFFSFWLFILKNLIVTTAKALLEPHHQIV